MIQSMLKRDLSLLSALITLFSMAFLVPPFLEQGEVFMRSSLLLALILAVFICRANALVMVILVSTIGVILVAFFLPGAGEESPNPLLYYGANALFLMTLIVHFLGRIFQSRSVDTSLLLVAVCVYLAFAAFAAMLYGMTDFFSPGAIQLPTSSAASDDKSVFMYFSIVTLSTLGYGDVFPATEQARTIAAFEAVTGQVFLTFVVARLVGLHVAASPVDGEKDQ